MFPKRERQQRESISNKEEKEDDDTGVGRCYDGLKRSTLCFPSQNGCLVERPHVQYQQVLPASTSVGMDPRLAQITLPQSSMSGAAVDTTPFAIVLLLRLKIILAHSKTLDPVKIKAPIAFDDDIEGAGFTTKRKKRTNLMFLCSRFPQ